jgi:hypothetical protein
VEGIGRSHLEVLSYMREMLKGNTKIRSENSRDSTRNLNLKSPSKTRSCTHSTATIDMNSFFMHTYTGEHTRSLQFRKFIVKQSGNIIRHNFQILHYSCQSSESKLEHVIAMICCQAHENKGKVAIPLYKANSVLWFNRNKYAKQVQRRYRKEFGVDPLYKPSIYAFFKQFCETFCV